MKKGKALIDLKDGLSKLKKIFKKSESEARREDREEKSHETQFWLMRQRFKRHKVAMGCLIFLVIVYLVIIFNRFFAPYQMEKTKTDYIYAPISKIHFRDETGFSLRPFVYGLEGGLDRNTLRRVYNEDKTKKYHIKFFVRSYEWKVFGIFKTDLHLFGMEERGVVFLLGTDSVGRDMFSRILFGSLISLTIGWAGVAFGLTIAIITGGISGIFGGPVDLLIQRWNEILMSYPSLPLWIALGAVIPRHWDSMQVYIAISVILSLLSSGGLSRTIRGKVLSLKQNEYVIAARALGADTKWVLAKHIIPGYMSYIIVVSTLRIPGMILGESAMGFLGLGIRPPMCSLGTLMQGAQQIQTLAHHPWLLFPALVIVVVVLAFSFLGDGLRDIYDPKLR